MKGERERYRGRAQKTREENDCGQNNEVVSLKNFVLIDCVLHGTVRAYVMLFGPIYHVMLLFKTELDTKPIVVCSLNVNAT